MLKVWGEELIVARLGVAVVKTSGMATSIILSAMLANSGRWGCHAG